MPNAKETAKQRRERLDWAAAITLENLRKEYEEARRKCAARGLIVQDANWNELKVYRPIRNGEYIITIFPKE